MLSDQRREMFKDLYRMAEYYEKPPFQPGDFNGNADWFIRANEEQLRPFIRKYSGDHLAADLAMAIIDEAGRKAVEYNKMETML